MKKTFIFAAMAAIAMTACNKEEIAAPEEGQNLVYREYTATIEDGASTKVAFGTPDENTIPAYFQDGDEIALTDGTNVYKGTVSVPENGGNTIIKTEVPETFTLSAAYYPYDAYKDGKLTVPATQTYGSVPVLLQSSDDDIEGENITFSAAEAGSAVICYTLTGDIAVKEARLYVTDNASLINVKPAYTLNFTQSLQLSDSPAEIYFAVPANVTKSLTLEIRTEKPESGLGTSDFSYFRRKTTAIEINEGSVIEMPAVNLTEDNLTAGRMIWRFGSENGGDCGWFLKNAGENTIDATNPQYASVTMNNNGSNTFRADFVYKKGFEVNVGTYHYVAIMGDFENILRNCDFDIPEGSSTTAGNIIFDAGGQFGQWHGNNSKNGKTNSPIKTDIEGVSVWYYEMLGDFGKEQNTFLSTIENTTVPEGNEFQFKMADLKVTNVPDGATVTSPQYKIYWIGFFNNTSEIQAMIDQTEAAVAE